MLTLSISSKPSSRFTAVYQVYTMSIIGKADHDMLQLFAKFLSTPLVDRERNRKIPKMMHPSSPAPLTPIWPS